MSSPLTRLVLLALAMSPVAARLGDVFSPIFSPVFNGALTDPNFVCGQTVTVKTNDGVSSPHAASLARITIENPSNELTEPFWMSVAPRGSSVWSCWVGEKRVECGWQFPATTNRTIEYAICLWDSQWYYGVGGSSAAIATKDTHIIITNGKGCELYERKRGTAKGETFIPRFSACPSDSR